MAITVNQTPSIVLDTFPVYAHCVYVVTESVIGLYKFSYTVAIEHYNGSTYDAVATLKVPKNSSDAGVFDVGEILRSYMASNNPGVAPNALIEDVGAEQFRFTFGSEQAATATGAPIANASTAQEVDKFWNGIGWRNLSGEAIGTSTVFALNDANTGRALTSSGYPQYSPRIRVADDELGSIDFLRNLTGISANRALVKYFNGTTLLSSTTIFFDPISLDNTVSRFWCYPAGLESQGTANLKPSAAANSGWTRYTVQFTAGAVAASQTHTFVRDNQCAPQSIAFKWLNEFGGYEFMETKGSWNLTTQYEDKTYEQARGNWYTAGASELYAIGFSERGTQRIVMSTERVIQVHTGTMLKEDTPRVESLLRSRSVYARDPESDSNLYYPCIINARSLRHIHPWTPDVIQYSFEFKFSNQPVTLPV